MTGGMSHPGVWVRCVIRVWLMRQALGEQPTRLRILWGESPLSSIARFWTTSISEAWGGNKPRVVRMEKPQSLKVGAYVGQNLSFTRNGQTTEGFRSQGQNRARENP